MITRKENRGEIGGCGGSNRDQESKGGAVIRSRGKTRQRKPQRKGKAGGQRLAGQKLD